MIPVQTALFAWLGFGIQPHYKTSGSLGVEQVSKCNCQHQVIEPGQWPKVGHGAAKEQLKKDPTAMVMVLYVMVWYIFNTGIPSMESKFCY